MTPETLRAQFIDRKHSGKKFAALTAADYPAGKILNECGLDFILVGDSLGMVELGYPDTTHVTLEEMLHHTRAVARGTEKTLLIGDLPYRTYETPEQALESSRAFIDAGAQAVKLEGGRFKAEIITALTGAGIPVCAHIGMLPQSVKEEGGYVRKGGTAEEAELLLADAMAVAGAGAFAVVLEIVDEEAAAKITNVIEIPTIGIGSGKSCDGQILVTHDLIGLFPWFHPPFARQRADVAGEIRAAAHDFVAATRM